MSIYLNIIVVIIFFMGMMLHANPSSSQQSIEDKENSKYLIPIEIESSRSMPAVLPSRNLDQSPLRTEGGIYDLPKDMSQGIDDPDKLLDVKFNFDAESIISVVEMFSFTLEFQYFIDPAVSGTVTVTIDTKMTRKETWQLFEHILWITGSYASRQNKFIDILPFAKLPQERRLFATHDPIPNADVRFIRLFHTTAAEIITIIKPFMTAGATVVSIQYLNSLLLVEAPPNVPKILEMIEKLDIIGESKWPQISIPCLHVDTNTILDELKIILPTIGFPVSGEKGDGRSIKLVGLERLQVILAAAPTVEVLEEVQRWVRILDTEDTVEQERIFFYNVKYNKAEDLSDSIGAFFNASSSSTGGTRRSSASPSPGSSARQRSQQRRTPRSPARNTNEKPETIFDIPVIILADGSHNRLIFRTTVRAYAMVEALLQRLDTPPLQALINVIIAEINLKKDTTFGFRFAAQTGGDFKFNFNSAKVDSNGNSGVANSDLYNVVFGDGITKTGDIFSFIQATAGKGNSRVLSAPQIIVISDEEASINIGDSIPIVTRQLNPNNNNDNSSNVSQDIQYQDTGTILTVTPHITAKKLITLDIRQEVSAALPLDGAISPTIQTRTIETSMTVKDGTTVLLGGFMGSVKSNTRRKVPILGDIPYLGKLFQFKENSNRRTELLLIINVRVIDIETDLDQVIKRYSAALEAIEEDFGEHVNQISVETNK